MCATSRKIQEKSADQYQVVQCKSFLYLSHQPAVMAQASLRICADSLEPTLLPYSKYG